MSLTLQGQTEVVPVKVDPDDFTDVIESLQPPLATTNIVEVRQFEVTDRFGVALGGAVRTKLKKVVTRPELYGRKFSSWNHPNLQTTRYICGEQSALKCLCHHCSDRYSYPLSIKNGSRRSHLTSDQYI